jgi:hypothetical protein
MKRARPPIGIALALSLCAAAATAAAASLAAAGTAGAPPPAVAATAAAPPPPAAGTAGALPRASAVGARLRVAFVPDTPGARTTVELSLRVYGERGQPPPPMSSMTLRLPAGMGIATTTLGEANCAPAALIAAGLSGCSANALLGFGTATAIVPVSPGEVVEHATLHALMGPPRETRVEVLFYVEASGPVFAQLVLPAVLAEDRPPYGERLQTSIPLVEVWPEGPDLSLRSIEATIGPLHLLYHRRAGSKTVYFRPRGVRIPRRCPRGGYPFAALLSFAGGARTSAEYRVPCR